MILHLTSTGKVDIFAGTRFAWGKFSGDGGAATAAMLNWPTAVAWANASTPGGGAAGTLLIADAFNGAIRSVDAATGIISTVAGVGCPQDQGSLPFSPCNAGNRGAAGDAAVTAVLNSPTAIASNRAGM